MNASPRRAVAVAAAAFLHAAAPVAAEPLPAAETVALRSMWIGNLPEAPDDPSNAHDTDPRAAILGRRLFFDTGLSANGALSCASCHRPELGFQDGKPVGEGLARLERRTMPLVGVAWNTWFFWDGRKDSLWSQALAPLENPRELAMTRAGVAARIASAHRAEYEAVFGPLPADLKQPEAATRVFVHAGKAIAAFERTLAPSPSRFDAYAKAVLQGEAASPEEELTASEKRGFSLFVGKARCTNCHGGPLLTSGEFHFTRVPLPTPDAGRTDGIAALLADEFSCTGRWSDARPEECAALRFLSRDARDIREARYAFKIPSLRGVAERAPYMHAGQFRTLSEVLRFYRDTAEDVPEMGHGGLSDADLTDLEAFLRTLTPLGTASAAPSPR
jgi:cytochrome c peroxidase